MHTTHPLMLVIICAKYGKDPSRTVCSVERTQEDVPYFSIFIAKSWLYDLEDIGQGQRSLCATHPLMLVIICVWYRKNPSRPVGVTERTQYAGRTYRRMDGRSEINIPPQQLRCAGDIIMTWSWISDQPLGINDWPSLPIHICVTRPWWVGNSIGLLALGNKKLHGCNKIFSLWLPHCKLTAKWKLPNLL